MLGAIGGDIIGSYFEIRPVKTTDFPLFTKYSVFTDDTVLTVAIAHAILRGEPYATALKRFGRQYPQAGYGGTFYNWMLSDSYNPYHSWGNGSAMRVSPVAWAFESFEKTLDEARQSAEVTHNHPEGIKGALAVAAAIFMARSGEAKTLIREVISRAYGYDLNRTLDEIRPTYHFDVACQGSVPESIIAFLESDSYEDAVRKAVSLGGDSDTMACIAGAIAEAFYGEIPAEIAREIRSRLPSDLLDIVDEFEEKFPGRC
ncbi:MAG: ADP-ribosylglycohydrolase family protein [Blastocatellia bacterium]|nr:ADP-ribosylglycohydrolase family protein [Blastocatellia bacterium]